MTKDQVEDEVISVKQEQAEDDQVMNVFVHSTCGLPDAWTEDEVDCLLASWRAVLEQQQAGPPLKLYDASRRVAGRLLRDGEGGMPRLKELKDRRVVRDEVRRLMKLLRNEYTVFKGMQKIEGLRSYRHPCVDQLEHIFELIPQSRRAALDKEGPQQPRRRRAVSEGAATLTKAKEEDEDAAPSGGKPRSKQQQRSMNLTRLVRLMVSQQQTMLEQFERLFKVLEVTSRPIALEAAT
ncbi:hypothetical protein JTE90_002184 [Oedothorax gibbosus]|uniref:Uncharacterized protein n=1 Tax=Oedothorax gibbosus TaxID=931172 RepID=A0AAV6VIN3_9ARAC|nr:hypothetical protein JTE90_002184 [Oedothorax gibbosus]